MGILSWIIFGLIAGILAKWIMPGKDGGGFFMTILLGIVGAGNDSNLLIVFYVQIMPDDFVMQLHRF